jgi:hypothetical protein
MTNIKVINNSKLEIQPRKLKSTIVDTLKGVYDGIGEITTILMDNLHKAHETSRGTFYILFQASPFKSSATEEGWTIGGHKAKKYIFDETSDYAVLKSDLYYYNVDRQEVYVPYDLSDMSPEELTVFVEYIIKDVKLNILDEIKNENSWKLSKSKEVLEKRVSDYLSENTRYRIESIKSNIKGHEDELKRTKEKFIRLSREIPLLENELGALEGNGVHGLDNFMKGLDTIADHPRVTNLLVRNDKVEIHVSKVVTRAQVGAVEKFFYMGDMNITININNADVRFFGNEKRRSHWTSNDPHPHVNGSSGTACLGNVQPAIVELCSQLEIYPVFLMCLDFLSNANTADTAGKHVVNWEECTEEGVLLKDLQQELPLKAEPVVEVPKVRVITGTDLTTSEYEEENAKQTSTYVAYEGYIGYVHNDVLEEVEQLLSEGAVVR